MIRAPRHITAAIAALCIAFLGVNAQAQSDAPCAAYNDPSNPQLATCNGASGSSKLFPQSNTGGGNEVTIFAKELSNVTIQNSAGVYRQCHTVINEGNNAFFVPWNSPHEWSSFLTAAGAYQASNGLPGWLDTLVTSGCCRPIKLTQMVCPTSAGGVTLQLPRPISLGARKVGTALNNGVPDAVVQGMVYSEDTTGFADYGVGEWGAQGDVSATTTVSQDAQGNPINFQITYACDSSNPHYHDNNDNMTPAMVGTGAGGWITMYWTGSCVPSDGQCGTIPNGVLTALPTDPVTLQNTLCAVGSVLNVSSISPAPGQPAPNGWTWTCNGTGGSGCTWDPGGICVNKQCAASNTPAPAPANGQCGSYNGSHNVLPVIPTTNFNGVNLQDRNVDGQGPDGLTNDGNFCAVGTVSGYTPVNYWGPQNPSSYVWECPAVNGGQYNDWCSAYIAPAVNAQCQTFPAGTFYTDAQMATIAAACLATPGLPCPTLCASGSLNAAPSNNNDTSFFWSWQCNGSNGGNNASCNRLVIDAAAGGQCGTDNNAVFSPQNPGPPTNLCQSSTMLGITETPINFHFNPALNEWTWQCEGMQYNGTAWVPDPDLLSPQCQAYNVAVLAGCGSAQGGTFATAASVIAAGLCAPGDTPISRAAYGDDHCASGDLSIPCTEISGGSIAHAWAWACAGSTLPGSATPLETECFANPPPPTPQPGQCGSTTANPCAYGTINGTPQCDTNNPPNCTWTCTGDNNLQSPQCSGVGTSTTTNDANGACGLANHQPSFISPNQNLCNSGTLLQPPGVTSTASLWAWTCQGSQTNSPLCTASICSQCAGNPSRSNQASFSVSGRVGTCNVTSATAVWTETDDLTASTTVNGTITGTTSLGTSFSINVTPASPPSNTPAYCTPCNMELDATNSSDGIHSGTFTVTASGTDDSGHACSAPLSVSNLSLH